MQKRNSWLRQYFRNYLLIGLVPVALFVLLFIFTTLTSYRTEIESSRYHAFSQLAGSVDHLLGQLSLVKDHLASQNIDADALDPSHADYSAAYADQMVHALAACEDQLLWDVPTMLFLRGTPTLYTKDGATTYEDFQRTMSTHGNLDYTGFFTALNTVKSPVGLRLVRDWRPSSPGDMMAILHPLPVMEPLPDVTLCFFVSEQVLQAMMDNCITDLPGNLYLISSYKEALTCEGVIFDGEKPQVAQIKGTGILPMKHEGREYVVMRSMLTYGSMALCFLCEEVEFYRSLHGMWMIFIGAALAVLALAVFFAVVMTRRSYAPLQRLVDGMPETDDAPVNEFDRIQTHMDAVEERNLTLNQQLARQRPMMIDACLSKLLLGKADTAALADFLLRSAGIDMSGRSAFAVLIGAQADTVSAAENFLDGLREKLNLTLPGGGQSWAMMDDVDGLLALMVLCPAEEDPRESMIQLLLERAGAQWPVRLTAGAGRLCTEPTQLHESCMEALAVVREFLPGTDVRFACYDKLEPAKAQIAFPTLDYALLNQSLKQADYAMAQRALEKIVEDIDHTDSMLYAQCMRYDVVNNMLRTVQNLTPQFPAQKLHAMCTFRTPEEFQRNASGLIDEFCVWYASMRETRSSRMREDLLAYVAERVYSYDFSLEQIADTFNLSQSYLSRFFKQETGYTFTQYITLLRLDRAKRLLAETALPLKEIVLQIGYVDAASFVRKFKASEGVTPGQWRELYHK